MSDHISNTQKINQRQWCPKCSDLLSEYKHNTSAPSIIICTNEYCGYETPFKTDNKKDLHKKMVDDVDDTCNQLLDVLSYFKPSPWKDTIGSLVPNIIALKNIVNMKETSHKSKDFYVAGLMNSDTQKTQEIRNVYTLLLERTMSIFRSILRDLSTSNNKELLKNISFDEIQPLIQYTNTCLIEIQQLYGGDVCQFFPNMSFTEIPHIIRLAFHHSGFERINAGYLYSTLPTMMDQIELYLKIANDEALQNTVIQETSICMKAWAIWTHTTKTPFMKK